MQPDADDWRIPPAEPGENYEASGAKRQDMQPGSVATLSTSVAARGPSFRPSREDQELREDFHTAGVEVVARADDLELPGPDALGDNRRTVL